MQITINKSLWTKKRSTMEDQKHLMGTIREGVQRIAKQALRETEIVLTDREKERNGCSKEC